MSIKFRLSTWPNFVTLLRIILLFVLVVLIYNDQFQVLLTAAGLSVLLIIMDWFDGYLARKLDQKSILGSVLDIAGDRIVEVVLWICIADLRLVPVWIPIIVISRGIITDAFRMYVLRFGYTAYGDNSMMRSPLGRFLTGSAIMRTGYAILKAVSFGVLLLVLAFRKGNTFFIRLSEIGSTLGYWMAVFTAVICLIRGIPVIVEGLLIINKTDIQPSKKSMK